MSSLALLFLGVQASIGLFTYPTHLSPSPPCRDDRVVYLAGLGTVGIEVHEQVPKLDAVIVPAGGQSGVLVGTAVAIKHLNRRIAIIVCMNQVLTTIHMWAVISFLSYKAN